MATDYDAVWVKVDDEATNHSLREMTGHPDLAHCTEVDADESDLTEGFELPGADLSDEELSVSVIPKRANEFICSCCYLVYHRSQLATVMGDYPICVECAR